LKGFERELGHVVERRVVHWGREGEYTMCIDLAEVGASRRRELVEKLRSSLQASDCTRLVEDAECAD
jgi:hypothetical protein